MDLYSVVVVLVQWVSAFFVCFFALLFVQGCLENCPVGTKRSVYKCQNNHNRETGVPALSQRGITVCAKGGPRKGKCNTHTHLQGNQVWRRLRFLSPPESAGNLSLQRVCRARPFPSQPGREGLPVPGAALRQGLPARGWPACRELCPPQGLGQPLRGYQGGYLLEGKATSPEMRRGRKQRGLPTWPATRSLIKNMFLFAPTETGQGNDTTPLFPH